MKRVMTIAVAACGLMGFVGSTMAAGYLDQTGTRRASGWACDPSAPSWQGDIRVVRDDGMLLAQAPADMPREAAVAAQCGGNANHGFDITWSASHPNFFDGQEHYIHSYYKMANGAYIEIPGSPVCYFFGAIVGPSSGRCD